MLREISAGGVVVRHTAEGWMIAVIEPQRKEEAASSLSAKKRKKVLLALPKGLVDKGEDPKQAAAREILEETGITAAPITKLADIKYVYVRHWSDHERVFKIVTFYLFRYSSGLIDDISAEMRTEVSRASWVLLQEAERQLAYRGEREVVRKAREYIDSHPQEMDLAAD